MLKTRSLVAMRKLDLTGPRPPMVWTAALLFFVGGLGCLLAVLFPISTRQPIHLDMAVGAISIVLAAALWVFGRWARPLLLQLIMTLGSLMISAIVARAATSGGAILTAFAYPWIAVYTAHFFSRRVILTQALLISVGFGAGLLIDELPDVTLAWVIVVGTVFSTGFVLGNLSENLRSQAVTDQLTGLLNRGGFLAAAARERAIAGRSHSRLTIAVLDLDGFKQVNDTLGHAAGDRLLTEVGRAWRESLRDGDILARYGGDEFVLLMPATSLEEAHLALARLDREELSVSWSIGATEWQAGEDLEACLARADHELYGAKQGLRAEAPIEGDVAQVVRGTVRRLQRA